MSSNNNPWLGLKTYSEGQTIYGRSEEINALSQDIIYNRQTVVYGKSGIGKSSLLNAGIFPILRRSNMFPINVRLVHNDKNIDYFEQIKRSVESSLLNLRRELVGEDGNIITMDGLNGKKEELCEMASPEGNESLWEYFHRHVFKDDKGVEIYPVVVFDQFEEMFTLCKSEDTRMAFFKQLADLINDVPPSYIYETQNLGRKTIEDDVSSIDFDEDFELVEDDEKESRTYKYLQEPNFHLVITLREDFLSYLERYTTNIPLLKHNRYCLRPLSDDQAGIIISDPVPGLISEDVAIEIICKITDSKPSEFQLGDGIAQLEVDSAILSLFLSELYKKKSPADKTISIDLVRAAGDDIITSFYERTISGISQSSAEYLEKRLVTEDERRDSMFEDRALSRGVTKEELQYLKDERLIHEFPWNDDGMRIEFMHDILCPIIVERRKDRERQRIQDEESRKKEEESKKLLQEEEAKRKEGERKAEEERIRRNIEYNQKKRATEHNVLVHKGRRLLDNALDFGELRTMSDTSTHNGMDKIIDTAKIWSRTFPDYLEDINDSDFTNQQVFSDPLLKDSLCALTFYRNDESSPTIDGLYGVELQYKGSLISGIHFKGKKVLSDGSLSFDEPIYILGGYCGIHIDYDDCHREILRTYLDERDNPIVTQDGYSSVQTEYDQTGNPIKIRYFNFENGTKRPAKHIHGNYGFDSIFDKNGNEVERYFVDESGKHTMIVSGVYGKRMSYYNDTFRLSSISNIDANGILMADKDGYVTYKKTYNKDGKPTLDTFFDENEKPWETPDGTFGNIYIIDDSNNTITSFNVDKNGEYISKKDGTFKTVMKFNSKNQITEYFTLDANDNIIEADHKDAIKLIEYDDQNRIQTFKILDNKRAFFLGKRFEYNKEGTHVIREFYLSENGLGKNEDFGVAGIEFDIADDKNLPVLQIFINENKQFTTCNDGYNAIRTWEDENERIVKQLYYDTDGTPMPNNSGIYGVKVEHLDENTTKQIHIDADGNMMEDNNGVAYTVETRQTSGILNVNFNKDGEPHENDGWVYIYQNKEFSNDGYKETIFVQNAQKEKIEIRRPRRADSGWEFVPCMIDETCFDDKGRLISQYFKDADGNIVGDSQGDSYTIWEYDDKNNIEILSLYNINGELKLRARTRRDDKGRVVEQSYIDENDEYVELERGYSGEIYEYDDDERRKRVTLIDAKGKACNNKDGFAHRIWWYDNVGRTIAQKDVTADGIVHGSIGFCEFIDTEERVNAYYLHQEDGQGNAILNETGSVFNYFEEDAKGRTVINLYLDANKQPIADHDGDFGVRFEYDDDKRITIMTCLGENRQPHNNNLGYGVVHIYKDDKGDETKRMHFSVDGTPVALDALLGCYGMCYEYPNEHNKITGYLDEQGNITTNRHGYAYKEDCFNPENGLRRVYYYDENRINTQSLEDEAKDFGFAVESDGDWRHIVSLGKDGQIANNAMGYARKMELYDAGKLRFYKYYNSDNKPMADSVGDYGTEILRSDDGSMVRLISLNEKYERHTNDYGYCMCDIITDIVGEQVRIWRDIEGNQVLPKERLSKKMKDWIVKFKKKEKVMPVFNCRQIGAIYDCILGNIEGNGLGKKYKLQGTYVLLAYDSWTFGDDSEELGKMIANATTQSKHLILLPVTLKGSLLQEVGDIKEIDFPAGQIGIRFKEWGINIDTLRIILEKWGHLKESL